MQSYLVTQYLPNYMSDFDQRLCFCNLVIKLSTTMFDKLFQAQQKAQEVKDRLDNISVMGEAEGGKVRVISSANKVVKEIVISEDLFEEGDKEQLEELLIVALNKAFAQADNVSQAEMQAVSQDMFGGLGNLFNK